jgi:hypothetical protein
LRLIGSAGEWNGTNAVESRVGRYSTEVQRFYGDRLVAFEGAGVKVQLQKAAASKLEAADEAEANGDSGTAERLRAEAQRLLAAASSTSYRYDQIRAEQASGWERTGQLETVVQQARERAYLASGPEVVATLFQTGKPGDRISALAMMQARPELVTVSLLTEGIENSLSAFEQYHTLVAAQRYAASDPDPQSAGILAQVVRSALQGGKFGAMDSDRCGVAERTLEILGPEVGAANP